jgi:hypothetical protein
VRAISSLAAVGSSHQCQLLIVTLVRRACLGSGNRRSETGTRVSCFGRNNPLVTARTGTILEQRHDQLVIGTDLENEANFSAAPHPFLQRCPIKLLSRVTPKVGLLGDG